MPIQIETSTSTNVVQVHLSGKLHATDYETLVPQLEASIEEHGKLRLIVIMDDFHGWDAAALWEDVKFDFKHFADFQRIAIVGDSRWQEGMALFCKPFTSAEVKYFEEGHLSVATNWLCKVI